MRSAAKLKTYFAALQHVAPTLGDLRKKAMVETNRVGETRVTGRFQRPMKRALAKG